MDSEESFSTCFQWISLKNSGFGRIFALGLALCGIQKFSAQIRCHMRIPGNTADAWKLKLERQTRWEVNRLDRWLVWPQTSQQVGLSGKLWPSLSRVRWTSSGETQPFYWMSSISWRLTKAASSASHVDVTFSTQDPGLVCSPPTFKTATCNCCDLVCHTWITGCLNDQAI